VRNSFADHDITSNLQNDGQACAELGEDFVVRSGLANHLVFFPLLKLSYA
jgi:hypothetical protein